ncbi:YciI family protein [Actinomycetes bacterium KLBMP 9797]
MQYLCLVYAEESAFDAMSPDEILALEEAAVATDEELRASGHLLLGQALEPVAAAITVRVRDGRVSTTDGPFAETKEQLGGFVFIEARDLAEATQIAARIPLARVGTIEVRPVVDLPRRIRERKAG